MRGELLYVQAGSELHRIATRSVTDFATSGTRLWLLEPPGLSYLDGDALVPTTAHPTGRLFGSPNGDVWIASGHTATRYSIERAIDPAWQSDVAPIFARVCSHCHVPGGSAGIDLSSPAAWRDNHDAIIDRVVVTRTMPPAGTDLPEADRRTLSAWLGAH